LEGPRTQRRVPELCVAICSGRRGASFLAEGFLRAIQAARRRIEPTGESWATLDQKLFPLLKVRIEANRAKAKQSPYETIKAGNASCTGLSILLIDACRAVGVPERLLPWYSQHVELRVEELKAEEPAHLAWATRHLEPDHKRSRAACKLGMALASEINRRREAAKRALQDHGQITGRIGRPSST
jgi:hypothetical protein